MHIEEFRDYCLLKAGVTEETPFGPETLVFKVGGKVFALTDIDTFGSINLKCDPERAVELREQHDYVLPGYHMNKKHWNTVLVGTGIPAGQLRELIDHSYDLVRASLPKKLREELREAEQEQA
ncbi:MmcQ/YjbR family DNA-binding protein [Hymenobacter metallicola]|uniref:MmcQ/YjbR family DNA-binding protein n=1 Tax=Hymenobacter metallicola TaxID=2563114 RepID=A0A4Z0QG53_9BACT|nr:MmcQ/YjbR family DNA-binding protein [Hymenobacter metallicola]TGE28456.1 MmcQ/YjbR family DNA-binding protein [Hymenobacter metallicola]